MKTSFFWKEEGIIHGTKNKTWALKSVNKERAHAGKLALKSPELLITNSTVQYWTFL